MVVNQSKGLQLSTAGATIRPSGCAWDEAASSHRRRPERAPGLRGARRGTADLGGWQWVLALLAAIREGGRLRRLLLVLSRGVRRPLWPGQLDHGLSGRRQ